VRAGIDHEIHATSLTIEVEVAAVVEDGWRDGKDAAIGAFGSRCHDVNLKIAKPAEAIVAVPLSMQH
jgi:hypothetical protein